MAMFPDPWSKVSGQKKLKKNYFNVKSVNENKSANVWY